MIEEKQSVSALSSNVNRKVFDAGGGPGSKGLNFQNLQKTQYEMFRRTIDVMPEVKLEDRAQEKRQIKPIEFLTKINVRVTRQDFPNVTGEVYVEYYPSSGQQAWEKFVSDICKKLGVEFIYEILEKSSKLPIYRIAKLKDRHEYLIRLRENSAVLEVLNTGLAPMENSWASTKDIVQVKQDLAHNISRVQKVNDRIMDIVHKPLTTHLEKNVAIQIQTLTQPSQILQIINFLYLNSVDEWIAKATIELHDFINTHPLATQSIQYGRIDAFYKKVDIIALHRLALERLNRLANQGKTKAVVKQAFPYIMKITKELTRVVDVVVIGMKVLSDLMPHLYEFKDRIFPAMLDVLQFYAPPSPAHRPRHPKRFDIEEESNEASLLHAGTNVEYNFETDEDALAKSIASMNMRSKLVNQFETDYPSIVPDDWNVNNQLSRYGDSHVMEADRLKYRKMTGGIEEYSKLIEFDEQLRPITPRTKRKKIAAQKLEQERKRLLKEQQLKAQWEEEERKRIQAERDAEEARIEAEEERIAKQKELELKKHRNLLTSRQRFAPTAAGNMVVNTEVVSVSRPTSSTNRSNIPSDMDSDNSGTTTPNGLSSSPNTAARKGARSRVASPNLHVPTAALQHVRAIAASQAAPTHYVDKQEDADRAAELSKDLKSSLQHLFPTIHTKNNPAIDPKSIEAAADSVQGFRPSDLAAEAAKKPKFKFVIKGKKKGSKQSSREKEDSEGKSSELEEEKIGWKGNKGEIHKPRPIDPLTGQIENSYNKPAFFASTKKKASTDDLQRLQEEFEGSLNGDDDDEKDDDDTNKDGSSSMKKEEEAAEVKEAIVPVDSTSRKEVGVSSGSGSRPQTPSRSGKHSEKDKEEVVTQSNNTLPTTAATPTSTATATYAPININGAFDPDNPYKLKKTKLKLQPLPTVPCPLFRGFELQSKESIVLIQAFATLLKMMILAYGYRDYCFHNHVLEEISEIVLVCPSVPRLLEYFVDMIQTLYSEGFGDPLDPMLHEGLMNYEDPSMVISHPSMLSGEENTGEENASNNVLFLTQQPQEPSNGQEEAAAAAGESKGTGEDTQGGELEEEEEEVEGDGQAAGNDADDEGKNDSMQRNNKKTTKTKSKKHHIEELLANVPGEEGSWTGKSLEEVSELSVHTIAFSAQLSVISVSDNPLNPDQPPPKQKLVDINACITPKITPGSKQHPSSSSSNIPSLTFDNANIPESPRSVGAVGDKIIAGHPEPSYIDTLPEMKKEFTQVIPFSANQNRMAIARQTIRHNQAMISEIGQTTFEARYVQTPSDSIIMAIAMCAYHIEVGELERGLAKYWLEVWNDNSFEYKALERKGMNLCGL